MTAMFINCPHCRALVATDPATDLPPEHCPRCSLRLREPVEDVDGAADPAGDVDVDREVDAVAGVVTDPEVDVDAGPDPGLDSGPGAPDAVVKDPGGGAGKRVATGPEVAAGTASTPQANRAVAVPRAVVTPFLRAPQPPPAVLTPEKIEDATGATRDAAEDGATPVPSAVSSRLAAPPRAAAPGLAVDPPVALDRAPDPAPVAAVAVVPRVSGSVADAPVLPIVPGDEEAGRTTPGDAPVRARDDAATPTVTAPRATQAPSFVARRLHADAPKGARRWVLPAVAVALSLVLGLQWLIADRTRLAAEARWRPLVISACGVFGCSVPAWRDPATLVLVSRDVRPHTQVPGVLRVQASLRNDAPWMQAWPRIVLTLSDVDGRAVATRAFTADEYLGDRRSAGLESGQTATVRFDVVEPATPVVAFGFDFR